MTLRVWRSEAFEGLELNAYRGSNREFPPSLLTSFNVGVRLAGVRETTYRGRRFASGPGTFLAYAPGVAMAAKPLSSGTWRYLDMSVPGALLGELLDDDSVDPERLAAAGAVEPLLNALLFHRFVVSHESFQQRASRLERETKLLAWLRPFVAGVPTRNDGAEREHRAVGRIRAYLHDHVDADVSLADLASLTGFNKHYLLRVFKRATGLTPYRYQMGLRLARSRTLLSRGVPPAQVASDVGLYDQSALNRLFRRHALTTPGRYQRDALRRERGGPPP